MRIFLRFFSPYFYFLYFYFLFFYFLFVIIILYKTPIWHYNLKHHAPPLAKDSPTPREEGVFRGHCDLAVDAGEVWPRDLFRTKRMSLPLDHRTYSKVYQLKLTTKAFIWLFPFQQMFPSSYSIHNKWHFSCASLAQLVSHWIVKAPTRVRFPHAASFLIDLFKLWNFAKVMKKGRP